MAQNVFSNASLTGATTVSGSVNFSGAQISGMYKRHVGLGLVDNTSDMDKPISNAVKSALDKIVGDATVLASKSALDSLSELATSVSTLTANSGSVADNAVTTAKIAAGAVNAAKIADGAVTTDKIADGNINSAKLSTGAVTNPRIADGAVTFAKLATDAKISFNNSFAAGLNDVAGRMVIFESNGTYVLNICVASGDNLNTIGTWKSVLLS